MSAMGGKLTTGPVGPGSTSPVRGALAQRVNAPGLIEAIPLDQAGAQERLSVTGCLEEDQVILEPGVIFPAARAFEPNKHVFMQVLPELATTAKNNHLRWATSRNRRFWALSRTFLHL
jgi:hypothetical protein